LVQLPELALQLASAQLRGQALFWGIVPRRKVRTQQCSGWQGRNKSQHDIDSSVWGSFQIAFQIPFPCGGRDARFKIDGSG
jgi:hypothetical protein